MSEIKEYTVPRSGQQPLTFRGTLLGSATNANPSGQEMVPSGSGFPVSVQHAPRGGFTLEIFRSEAGRFIGHAAWSGEPGSGSFSFDACSIQDSLGAALSSFQSIDPLDWPHARLLLKSLYETSKVGSPLKGNPGAWDKVLEITALLEGFKTLIGRLEVEATTGTQRIS